MTDVPGRLMDDDREPWEVYQDDIHALLDTLDLGTHARAESPHEVLWREILPAIQRLRRLTWTDEPPSEPGWYFARFKGDGGYGPTFPCRVDDRDGVLIAFTRTDFEKPIPTHGDQYEWAGPIPEPSERTEHQPNR